MDFPVYFFTGVGWWPVAIFMPPRWSTKGMLKQRWRKHQMGRWWIHMIDLDKKYKHETNMKFLQQKENHNLRLSPCSFHVHHVKSLIYIQNIHISPSPSCTSFANNSPKMIFVFNLFNFTHRSPHRSFPRKKWAPPTSEHCRNELKAKRRCSNNSTWATRNKPPKKTFYYTDWFIEILISGKCLVPLGWYP